jgi:hypothetical protein
LPVTGKDIGPECFLLLEPVSDLDALRFDGQHVDGPIAQRAAVTGFPLKGKLIAWGEGLVLPLADCLKHNKNTKMPSPSSIDKEIC